MLRRLFGLVRKEFAQILRDRILVAILIWAFTVAIYTAGHSNAMDVINVPTAVLDFSRSPASREFLSHLQPPYFKMVGYFDRDEQIAEWMDAGKAAIVVVIPPDFQRRVHGRGQAQIQVITDGALSLLATVAVAYVAQISAQYSVTVLEERGGFSMRSGSAPIVEERLRVRFNPNMSSAWFSSVLELMNMLAMVSLLLTSAGLVREKENDTLDQLLVSPAHAFEIFLAKIIPTLITTLALSGLSFLLILRPAFHVPIRGSLLLFYSVAALYVFAMSSLGIAIAVVAKNLAQAMMIMLLVLQPMIFLSGAWNPPEAMNPWLRKLSVISPMRFFIDFGYGVILKGNGLSLVAWDIIGIVVLGGAVFTFSLLWFRRSLAR
ncbi:MAG: ABC transporter permease [Acidobacteria bacterium]|nr:ABC transporter permease [Acidobacteriota bacterium]